MFFVNIAKVDKDDDNKSHRILKAVNRFFFGGRSWGKIMCCSGWSLLGIYSSIQIKYIIPVITKLICGGVIIVGGMTISAWLISYFIYEKEEEDIEEDIIETEQEKYMKFINNDYETFIDIYKEKKDDCFTNKTKQFIDELKEYENHEKYVLPYSYNPSIIFYYDGESQSFYYFCQSDVNGKILNSVCRTYTVTKKCIQLFQDDEEIKYMRKEAENCENHSEPDISGNDLVLSSSVVSDDSLCLTDEKEEESGGFVNIFYKKKKNAKRAKENKDEPLKTNKFIYKGTLDEYDKIKQKSVAETKSTKRASYEEYSYLK